MKNTSRFEIDLCRSVQKGGARFKQFIVPIRCSKNGNSGWICLSDKEKHDMIVEPDDIDNTIARIFVVGITNPINDHEDLILDTIIIHNHHIAALRWSNKDMTSVDIMWKSEKEYNYFTNNLSIDGFMDAPKIRMLIEYDMGNIIL